MSYRLGCMKKACPFVHILSVWTNHSLWKRTRFLIQSDELKSLLAISICQTRGAYQYSHSLRYVSPTQVNSKNKWNPWNQFKWKKVSYRFILLSIKMCQVYTWLVMFIWMRDIKNEHWSRSFTTCRSSCPVEGCPPSSPCAFSFELQPCGPGKLRPWGHWAWPASDQTHTGGRPGLLCLISSQQQSLRGKPDCLNVLLSGIIKKKNHYPFTFQFSLLCDLLLHLRKNNFIHIFNSFIFCR